MREMLEIKRDVVTGDWGKFRNEELKDLYCCPDFGDQMKEIERKKLF
jgi:hypothetical protein